MDISPKLRLDDDYADDTFGDDSEDQHFLTNFRSSNDRFQQKFQQAQHDANERQVEQDLDRLDSHEKPFSEKEWRLQEAHLHRKLLTVEKNIKHLQHQLTAWKEKRQTEASLAQLTPAERAAAAAASQSSGKPAQDGLTTDDVNSIFTYLFEVGEMPLHPNAAGLNEHTAVYARDDMKQQAFMNPQVLEQQEFSNITLTEVQETFDRAPAVRSTAQSSRNTNTSTSASQNEPDDRPSRHCLLRGRCNQCNFRISFVVDPTLKVEQLDFELDIDIQLDARSLLKEIKKSNNLLALFRLIRHYGRLEKDKFDVFAYIKKLYVDSSIKVTQRDAYELEFSSDLSNGLSLSLVWRYKTSARLQMPLEATVCERLVPDIRLTAKEVESLPVEQQAIMAQLPDKFNELMRKEGLIVATQMMVSIVLWPAEQHTLDHE